MQIPMISQKAARFTESVIRGMSIEARRYGAVNLAQGMPDFPAPAEVKAAACRAIEDDINQYAITWGAHELRRAIAEHADWYLGLRVDPETEITVTCGSTEAMLVTLLSLINPGDEVILTQPFYENYWPDCVLAGAEPRFVPLRPPHWRFDLDELAAAFNDRTKAIILCNPNNPTGTVFSRDDLEAVAALCRKWDAIAVTDEIYEHIIYDGRPHIALAGLDGMWERSVTIGGMSKTYAVTGWRVGTILAPPKLTHAFRQVHDFVSIGAAAPLQEAGAVAYRLPRPITTAWPPTTRAAATGSAACSPRSASSSSRPRARTTSCPGSGPSAPPTTWNSPGYLVQRYRRRHRARLELLPRQGPGPAVRPLLLLQAGRDARPGRRAAAEAAGHVLKGASGNSRKTSPKPPENTHLRCLIFGLPTITPPPIQLPQSTQSPQSNAGQPPRTLIAIV